MSSDMTLSEDEIVQLAVYALAAAHIVVLIWYWFRRNLTPVLAVNIALSGGVLAYWLPHLNQLFHYVHSVAAFVAFELLTFVLSVAAIATGRVPRGVIFAAFLINTILIAGAVYFLLTFKLTRLF